MTWRHFHIDEFACKHCGVNLMDHQFVTELDELRHRLGFPLVISSGYRCPKHNAAVSSTGEKGPHTTGLAADIAIDRTRGHELLQTALLMRFTGIGIKQHGNSRFIHLDQLPNAPGQLRPTIWSYP